MHERFTPPRQKLNRSMNCTITTRKTFSYESPAGASNFGRQHRNSASRSEALHGPDESENRSMNFSRNAGYFSKLIAFGTSATSSSRGSAARIGITVLPLRSP